MQRPRNVNIKYITLTAFDQTKFLVETAFSDLPNSAT